MHYLRIALIVLLLAASASSVAAAPAKESTTAVFFRETQNWIAPPFYQFWRTNGGLPNLRLPAGADRSDDQPG
ncbi:MAG: hypothetical protein RMJ48_02995 [Roseiflexaceae bacterium]|nr:hypothetical protein [Roseiflexaceae bacterium]